MEINKANFERVVKAAKAKTSDRRWVLHFLFHRHLFNGHFAVGIRHLVLKSDRYHRGRPDAPQ
jgi:hypothetical protein